MQLQEQYFTLISWDVWFEIEHIFILIVIILVICLTHRAQSSVSICGFLS